MKHAGGELNTAFRNELSRVRIERPLLDAMVLEYLVYRGLARAQPLLRPAAVVRPACRWLYWLGSLWKWRTASRLAFKPHAGWVKPHHRTATQKLRIVREGFRVGDRSRGRFATPADSPLHDCCPYSHVHVRRERVGFVPRSRTVFCRAEPNPCSDSQLLHRCTSHHAGCRYSRAASPPRGSPGRGAGAHRAYGPPVALTRLLSFGGGGRCAVVTRQPAPAAAAAAAVGWRCGGWGAPPWRVRSTSASSAWEATKQLVPVSRARATAPATP